MSVLYFGRSDPQIFFSEEVEGPVRIHTDTVDVGGYPIYRRYASSKYYVEGWY